MCDDIAFSAVAAATLGSIPPFTYSLNNSVKRVFASPFVSATVLLPVAPELDGALGFCSPGVTVLSLLLLSSDVVGELSILGRSSFQNVFGKN